MKFSDVLQAAADSAFVHPEGKKVPVTVHSAAYKKSSKGNDMIEVQFKVTGGPNAGKGKHIRHYLVFDNDTAIQQMMNLGIRKAELESLAQYEVEQAGERLAAMLVGKKGAADIVQDKYNGRLQNKINWINPAAGATGPKPENKMREENTDDAEESELDRVKRELEAAKATAKAASNGSRSEPPADLPF